MSTPPSYHIKPLTSAAAAQLVAHNTGLDAANLDQDYTTLATIIRNLHHSIITDINNANDELKKLQDAQVLQAIGRPHNLRIQMPQKFDGDVKKLKVNEWIDAWSIYFKYMGVQDDKQKITLMMYQLTGPAKQYMANYSINITKGNPLGTMATFEKDLRNIYGQRDDKEGARDELTELLNKTVTAKGFMTFAEKFRTLARVSEYPDDILQTQLRNALPKDIKTLMIGLAKGKAIAKWEDYLEHGLEFHKEMNPEDAKARIFITTTSVPRRDPDAMEIDAL